MTSSPKPLEVPPYQVQPLLATVIESYGYNTSEDGLPTVEVKCAQALGSEIYVGCSNGELLRFALQVNGPDEPESYSLLSRQNIPSGKPVDEIALAPSISRALILCDHQVYFYTLPALDAIPSSVTKPIRNVYTLSIDHEHMLRPAPPDGQQGEPIDFCVSKRSSIALYSLRDRLFYHKEIPTPEPAFYAKRSGPYLCLAGRTNYSVLNLSTSTISEVLPISQAPPDSGGPRIKPIIAVIAQNEFLILSWNGASTMGVFINGNGDAIRGILEWSGHPVAVCPDYPYITTLLPSQTIEIHSIETQALLQTIPAPPLPSPTLLSSSPSHGVNPAALMMQNERRTLIRSLNGFVVPAMAGKEKLRMRKVRLIRRMKAPGPSRPTSQVLAEGVGRSIGVVIEQGEEGEKEGEGTAEDGEEGGKGGGLMEVVAGEPSISEFTPSELGGAREEEEEGEDGQEGEDREEDKSDGQDE